MDEEKRLVAGLLGRYKRTAEQEELVARLKAVLGERPALVAGLGDVGEKEWAAWREVKSSQEGKELLTKARYRVALEDKREAARLATWLSRQKELRGRGLFIEVSSPVKVVEWKWPLAVAIMGGSGYAQARTALGEAIDDAQREWMKVVLRLAQKPAEQAGVADILVFPQGLAARETLLGAGALVTADLLVLHGVPRQQFGEVAAGTAELLRLTQANALLAADFDSRDTAPLKAIIEELAHDEPLDVAVAEGLRKHGIDSALVLLLSTARFIEESKISSFADRLKGRLGQIPNRMLDLRARVHWNSELQDEMSVRGVARSFKKRIDFSCETRGASDVSTVAAALSRKMAVAEARAKRAPAAKIAARAKPKRKREPETGAEARPRPRIKKAARVMARRKPAIKEATEGAPRFLLERLLAREQTRIPPEEALEATKRYTLEVHIGPEAAGYYIDYMAFPEPPVLRGESGVNLLVVFFEKNSMPDAQSRTIFLPRTGESSRCEFDFTVSNASKVFEGYVSVYHNNRFLQESVLRARVEGGIAEAGAVPDQTGFAIRVLPRPIELGREDRAPCGGTIRIEGDGTALAVRGLRTARVNLPGLKDAVDSLERAFDDMQWEDFGVHWVTDKTAAESLSTIAQQGWQLHEALRANPLVKEMADQESPAKPLVVYAADANVRAPLELCYTKTQPRSSAKVCPHAATAVAQGSCARDCDAQGDTRDRVCPLGFWGLSRVIEWRSKEADGRDDPETLEITNEPVSGRRSLAPLDGVLLARAGDVTEASMRQLEQTLRQRAAKWQEVKSWEGWEEAVKRDRPTLLVLMPHVDNAKRPPLMEVQKEVKNPPGIDTTDVVADPPQQPIVLLLGCGAAISLVDFMSLPAQLRRKQAAVVVAPVAQILTDDAPEIARAFIEVLSDCSKEQLGTRPFGQVLLSVKRKLVAEGKLAGILLLAFGDADWLV